MMVLEKGMTARQQNEVRVLVGGSEEVEAVRPQAKTGCDWEVVEDSWGRARSQDEPGCGWRMVRKWRRWEMVGDVRNRRTSQGVSRGILRKWRRFGNVRGRRPSHVIG